VYGIECSAISQQAKQIVADNGFTDKVTIITGKVRDRKLQGGKAQWQGPGVGTGKVWSREQGDRGREVRFTDKVTIITRKVSQGKGQEEYTGVNCAGTGTRCEG
jgi:hypothetical protein